MFDWVNHRVNYGVQIASNTKTELFNRGDGVGLDEGRSDCVPVHGEFLSLTWKLGRDLGTISLLISIISFLGPDKTESTIENIITKVSYLLSHRSNGFRHIFQNSGFTGLFFFSLFELVVGIGVEPVRPAHVLDEGVDLVPDGLPVVGGVTGVHTGPVGGGGRHLVIISLGLAGRGRGQEYH